MISCREKIGVDLGANGCQRFNIPWKRNIAFENKPKPKRKGPSSNHHFSEVMLNFRGVMALVMHRMSVIMK